MRNISLFDDGLPVAVPHSSTAQARDAGPGLSEGQAALSRIRDFMHVAQSTIVEQLMLGEEGQFFIDKMIELDGRITTMPSTHGQQDVRDPIAYLHYFFGGSDWYITEKDQVGSGVEQAFGYACLNGDMLNAEYGYIPIVELVGLTIRGFHVELDFHFDPVPMSEVIQGLKVKNGPGY